MKQCIIKCTNIATSFNFLVASNNLIDASRRSKQHQPIYCKSVPMTLITAFSMQRFLSVFIMIHATREKVNEMSIGSECGDYLH